MFAVLGVVGLLWLMWWLRVFTNHPEENSRVSADEFATTGIGVLAIALVRPGHPGFEVRHAEVSA